MSKMKLKCPVSSLRAAKIQIKFGATELYLGLASDDFSNLSYGGRGKTTWDGKHCTTSYEEIKEIVALAHENNVRVSYTANMPILYQDIIPGYLKYVEQGVDAGVDSLILGSIESIILLNKYKYPVDYISSVFTEAYNTEFLKWLEEMNISEAYLPHHMKLDELKTMAEATKIELGVFGHFGCSNSNGTCFLYHESGENINVGLPCRAIYNGYVGGEFIGKQNFLDAATDCSVCSIQDLYDAGVKTIKIVGRGKSIEMIGALTKIYRMAIDNIGSEVQPEQVREKAIQMMEILKTENCSLKRCKYGMDTPILRAFV